MNGLASIREADFVRKGRKRRKGERSLEMTEALLRGTSVVELVTRRMETSQNRSDLSLLSFASFADKCSLPESPE